jgi:hypothetical protein
MDLAHPIRSVVPTLDGPVLEVLAATTRPMTGLEVHRLAELGSPNGIRRALARLVDQGVVNATEHSAATFYVANRDHLAWPAVETLARMRRTLLDRLQADLTAWQSAPIHASLFGSMARGMGDATSDIDILIVRPTGTGEEDSPWADQVDALRHRVRAWTGNHCQAFQIDLERLSEHVAAGDPLVQEWVRDSLTLVGPSFHRLLTHTTDFST